MPRKQGEYVESEADGHGQVAEQVAADCRLVSAMTVPLRVMGL
jgi:hypothetical protein